MLAATTDTFRTYERGDKNLLLQNVGVVELTMLTRGPLSSMATLVILAVKSASFARSPLVMTRSPVDLGWR